MYSEIPLIFEAKFVFHFTMVSTRVTYCYVFYCIPQDSYLNCYLSFFATVTPGAKVSATEIPTQRWFSVGICMYEPGYKSHDLL